MLAYQIRQLASEVLNASEEALRSLIHRQLRKPDKTDADRDKIDLLLVQYFAMCAPEQLYSKDITLDDVARSSAARAGGGGPDAARMVRAARDRFWQSRDRAIACAI